MLRLGVSATLLSAVLALPLGSPASAQVLTINAFGVAPGTETYYSCWDASSGYPDACGSETKPWNDQLDLNMAVNVSTNPTNPSNCIGEYPRYFGPGICNLTIGVPQQVWIELPYSDLAGQGFTLTYLGQDQSGNYLFQGTDYTNFLGHYCGPYPACPGHSYTSSLASFTVGVVPEPATWVMMLLGFAGMGWALRRQPSDYSDRPSIIRQRRGEGPTRGS